MLQEMASHWWLVLLRGLLSILFGIFLLLSPGLAAVTLVTVFGIYAMVDGVFAVGGAVLGNKTTNNRLILGLEGVLGVIFGFLVLSWPGLSVIVLMQVIAIWALVTGAIQIVAAFAVSNWWLAMAGLLSILFGVYFFRFPGEGAVVLLTIIGMYAIVFGILFVIFSFRIRRLTPIGGAVQSI